MVYYVFVISQPVELNWQWDNFQIEYSVEKKKNNNKQTTNK